jgi:hypothetical protein
MARRRAERRKKAAPAPVARAVPPALAPREVAGLAALFALLALAVYAPALSGPFLSDDLHYVATNPYVHSLTLENVRAILDPRSPATVFVVNYAPVHLLLHALTWQVAGEQTTAYHVINVLLHAIGSALLAAVFARAGIPRLAAAGAALVFLLHPANVEAVAWISQAKTPAAFALSMGALLAHPRRPVLGTVLFGLALLAKPTAAFALPVAAILDWTRDGRVRAAPLAAWALLLAGYAFAEFATHQRSGAAEAISDDPVVRMRTSFAIAARYVWMSATSFGVAAFHEPEPSGVRDPVWMAGVLVIGAIAARSLVALYQRSAELAFWVWAGASFLPISQLFPFLYPMADRYLYFIMPGLMGGLLLALRAPFARGPAWLPRAAGAATLALAVAFGAHAYERATLWSSPILLLNDSASHYPNGRTARLVEARRAAQRGDDEAALAALRRAWELGFNRYEQLQTDPAFTNLRTDPRMQALIREMAGWWVTHFAAKQDPTQIELRTLALAYLARGERDTALATLERARATPGPLAQQLAQDIADVKSMR